MRDLLCIGSPTGHRTAFVEIGDLSISNLNNHVKVQDDSPFSVLCDVCTISANNALDLFDLILGLTYRPEVCTVGNPESVDPVDAILMAITSGTCNF